MKKTLLFVTLGLFAISAYAQEDYPNNIKSSKKANDSWYKEEIGNTTNFYENGMCYTIGFTVPFSKGESDVKSKYGARVEAGYLTSGQFSFYGGLAYQFLGYSFEEKISTGAHYLQIPLQASFRFGRNVPFQLKAGPYYGFNLYSCMSMDGTKVSTTKGLSFGDRSNWGLQFNFAVSYFTIGYTMQYVKSNGFKNGALTIGVQF